MPVSLFFSILQVVYLYGRLPLYIETGKGFTGEQRNGKRPCAFVAKHFKRAAIQHRSELPIPFKEAHSAPGQEISGVIVGKRLTHIPAVDNKFVFLIDAKSEGLA